LDGTSTAALIPANTFTTDLAYTYVGILGFAHLPVKDRVSYPLIIGCSGYASATGFELKTTLMGHPGAGSVKFSASNYIVGDNVGTAHRQHRSLGWRHFTPDDGVHDLQ
jgi:hypothetical protein